MRHAAAARAGQGQAAYRGVLLEARGSVLQVTATDGHQLAIRAVAWQGDAMRLLVRLSDLWTLMSALSLVPGEVTTLQVSEQSLLLDGAVQARVQLMDERAYPDFRTVIPSGHRPNLHVDADAFRAALRSVSTILSADDMVSMRATPLGLSLHAATPTARASVPVSGARVHAPFEVTTRTRMLHLALLADGELALTAVPGRTTLMLTAGPFLALMTRAAEVQMQVPPPMVPLDGRAPWEAVVASGQPLPEVTWDAVGRP
ncbi:hypothetical protein [Deinococcus multiflagellatus]|uniref:Uncharacterized protein n=1 Tax=Deinococcus multiflagellatus TaxID=1656887 RepID=A0ABW1ZSA5_9DEIO